MRPHREQFTVTLKADNNDEHSAASHSMLRHSQYISTCNVMKNKI